LLIEDELNVRTIMAEIVTYLGYNVVLADDGRTGINIIKNSDFDLIITDLGLPDYDGEQLIEYMRRNGIDTPVLMVGGVDEKTGAAKCDKWHSCYYIPKPFEINEIGRHLARLMMSSNKARINKQSNPANNNL